ncbi:MAG TPA: SDR family oxidoreductase [Sphingomonadaceae bacterium]|nr:SDR family oxidoreductase [Sphingomonadaceae bacterium]
MQGFEGKTALVTGAASGIGAACARWLDAQGIEQLYLVDLDRAGLAGLDLSCAAERIAGDVADPDFWRELEGGIDRLDHAVINAGIAGGGPLVEQQFEQWRKIMSVNLDGAFLTLATALRLIARGGCGGSIVMLSSVTALKPMAGTSAYATSKAGIAHLARIAALESASAGIRVNAVAPGGVDTPIWDKQEWFGDVVTALGSREAAMESMAKDSVPSGRFASADEIAGAIGFLLSDAAANITGVVLSSDGGSAL